MTRLIPARLLKAGPAAAAALAVVAMIVLAACGGSSPVASVGSTATAASSAPAAKGTVPVSAGAVDKTRTVSPYGVAPDRSLAKACLVSSSYVSSSLAMTDVVAKLSTASSQVCEYAGKADWASTSPTFRGPHVYTMLTGHASLPGKSVAIPNGAPFDNASVALAQGGAEAAANLSGSTQSVWFEAWDPHLSHQALLKLAKAGLQNIMYWWPKADSPAPLSSAPAESGGVQVPNLAACQVLPSGIFSDLLGGAAVANFDGSTAQLCSLQSANGARAVIADRPQSGTTSALTSTLTQVGHNVWEQDTNAFMTFVNGHEVGVESLGGVSLINSQAVIAALAALN